MMSKGSLFTGSLFTHDTWDHYWEGELKRDNGFRRTPGQTRLSRTGMAFQRRSVSTGHVARRTT
jgi:hypothetical protein